MFSISFLALDKIQKRETPKYLKESRHGCHVISASPETFEPRSTRSETTNRVTKNVNASMEKFIQTGAKKHKVNIHGEKKWTEGFIVKIPGVTARMLKMGPLAPSARSELVRNVMDQVMEVSIVNYIINL